MQGYARYQKAVAELDADFDVCLPTNVAEHLPSVDLVICSVDAARAASLSDLEKALQTVEGTAVLLVVDSDALKVLRLPTHVAADFVLPSSPDEELVVRMRHLLWPGEENAPDDIVTVDNVKEFAPLHKLRLRRGFADGLRGLRFRRYGNIFFCFCLSNGLTGFFFNRRL